MKYPSAEYGSRGDNMGDEEFSKVKRCGSENDLDTIQVSSTSLEERAVDDDDNSIVRRRSDVSRPSSDPSVRLLMFDLSRLNRTRQFVILSAAVFAFYLLYGYIQELMFRIEGLKEFGWYITLVQFAFYSVFGFSELYIITGDTHRRIPLVNYLLLAFLTVATMGLSNSSLSYLNYPTQVIFKCCKLIPVLLGGYFIQGKVYGVIDVMACSLMSVGLILFTLADSTVSPVFSIKGVSLISMALVADAGIGNVQEKVMKRHQSSSAEMVLYSYSIGFLYLLAGTLITGEFTSAFYYCLSNPVSYFYLLLFSITGYLGINIVLTLVKSFGALVAVTVTTFRKAVTIVLSFIFFTKPFTMQYIWSGVVVVLGIYLNVYGKKRQDIKSISHILQLLQEEIQGRGRTLLRLLHLHTPSTLPRDQHIV